VISGPPRPPPPPGRNRRRHVRYELFAQVEVRRGDDVSILPVVNISAGGVLLQLSADEPVSAQPGAVVTVFLDVDLGGEPLTIELDAEVVRLAPGDASHAPTMALMWTSDDPAVAQQLMAILSRLRTEAP
jgi:c-di-GMP-binding flagellar brake protein YcgR